MKSGAADVDSYIAEQPPEWRSTLEMLREACRRHLHGYVESMTHGMPSYARDGQVEVSFAKQARYLSLYILKEPVLDANRDALAGLDLGKGCARYRRPDQVDWQIVYRLLTDTVTSNARVC